MSYPSGSRSWWLTLLIAMAVLLTAGVIVVAVVPMVLCKECALLNAYQEQAWSHQRFQLDPHSLKLTEDPKVSATPPPPKHCEDCRPGGKMTLLRSWVRRARTP